jgi:hypothetical protein
MTQNATTVTAANPTPPTNLIFVGNTPALDSAQPFADDGISKALPNSVLGGSDASTINEEKNSTYPIGITFATSTAATNTAGSPGAGVSNTHEARGTETSSTAASPTPSLLGQTRSVGVGPAATAATLAAGPNASHASSLSPTTVLTPTATSCTAVSNVSGSGYSTLTVTGTNFNRTSVVYLNGAKQITNYVSATSLTVTNALKRTTAGTLPVFVINENSGIQTATVNWTLT